MAGNVWEWTTTNAPGSSEVFVKGGGWADRDPAQLRGAMHMRAEPGDTSADIGFRCVRDI
jgi:formylglycine-generating enzyme required for sulfatase activity